MSAKPVVDEDILASVNRAREAQEARLAARTSQQIEAAARAEVAAVLDRRKALATALERASDSLTPPAHSWASADAPELLGRVNLPAARRWASSPPTTPRVLLCGPTGSGKTSMAAAALRTAERRRWDRQLAAYDGRDGCARPRFTSDAWFIRAHRLGVCRIQLRAGHGEAPEVERAMACGWLILDDLGGEAPTANNAIPEIICERYDRDALTWVTTGLNITQISVRYGDGFLRRLIDRATVVKLGEMNAE